MSDYDHDIYDFDTVSEAMTYCDFTSRFGPSPETRSLFCSLGSIIRTLAAKVESQAMEMERAEAARELK